MYLLEAGCHFAKGTPCGGKHINLRSGFMDFQNKVMKSRADNPSNSTFIRLKSIQCEAHKRSNSTQINDVLF